MRIIFNYEHHIQFYDVIGHVVVTWYKVETIGVRLKKVTAVKVKQTLLAPVRVTACMHMFEGATFFGVTAGQFL